MTKPVTLLMPVLGLLACATAPAPEPHLSPASQVLTNATQLVVVTTSGWDSVPGELRRYTRADAHAAWQRAGAVVPIVVGRTGLAWGVGFDHHAAQNEPVKHEGDGRSPAGIFAVRTAFGFAPADSMKWVRLSYLQLTSSIECVDDTASVHYNNVVDRHTTSVDWQSSERMRQVAQYRLGAIIDYNAAPPAKGRGSCIFFHIWGGPRAPTVGCTAMAANNLEPFIAWLDASAHPAVVQLPAAIYARVRSEWALPQLY